MNARLFLIFTLTKKSIILHELTLIFYQYMYRVHLACNSNPLKKVCVYTR